MTDQKICKNLKKYGCEICYYYTSDKNDYNKHIQTIKHNRLINTDEKSEKIGKLHICDCGKSYKHSQSLFTHKKKCQQNNSHIIETNVVDNKNNSNGEITILKEMLFELVNQNKELQKTVLEQNKTINEMIPKIGNNNTSNTTNNNIIVNNLTLLNNKCKDAISINEFIDSIQIEMKDLIYTSDKGLTSGITNLFLENYNKLPIQKRPLWCGDKKRKKIYIKEEEWHEDKDNIKTKEAIKSLTAKQAKNSGKYTKENPDWMDCDKKKDRFINIVKQTTLELDNDRQSNIINNLLENVHLTDNTKDELQK
jgi:hypothetical protein